MLSLSSRAIRRDVKLPEGYRVEFGGQFEHLREARARLAVVVPAALALIFILIFMAFERVRQALLVYTGIPLAVTGGCSLCGRARCRSASRQRSASSRSAASRC